MTRKLAIVAAMLGVALTPAAAHARGGVDVRLNGATSWPNRELVVSLPSKRALSDKQVTVLENGAPVYAAKLTSAAANRKRGVMLIIDASLTMRGEPIRQAMVAARSFAKRRSHNTPVGVMYFSRAPRVALAPTIDARRIASTLAIGPALTRGTKIFDATSAGITALRRAGLTSGAVVVLSDGAEAVHGSSTTPAALGAFARRSNVRVFSVGLRSASFDPAPLRTMASATGGRYGEAAQPKDLPPLFAAIGDRLSSEYLVSYRSTAPAGAVVQLQARVDGLAGATGLGYRAPVLSVGGLHAGSAAHASSALESSRMLLLAIAFFSIITVILYLVLRPQRRSVVARVTDFAGVAVPAPTLADVRRRPAREPSALWRRLVDTVELSGIGVSPAALVLWTLTGTLVAAWYLGIAVGQPPLLILAVAIPIGVRLVVMSRLGARRRAFAEQLPDNLQVLASALRAGYSFSAGLAAMAEDAPEPSRSELRRASTDEQLGVDVAESLHAIGARMDSPEIEYVGIVANMQREAGGNTAEVLDQVIETIRSRQQITRTVRTLTAQGRLGGAVISAMPIVVALGMAALHPGYYDPMFASSVGVLLLLAGVVMLAAGWLVIRKVVDVEP